MSNIKTLPPARRAASARLRFAPSALVLALSSALALPGAALATEWTGAVDTDWFTPGNWNPGNLPMAADDVFIGTTASTFSVINTGNAVVNNVILGTAAGVTGALVLDTSTLASANAMLGADAGSGGVMQLSGSSWTNSGLLIVGNMGTGQLTVVNASTLSGTAGVVGSQAGSMGMVNVDGAGSAWNNSADLHVGGAGTGGLMVSNAGTVNSANGFVGNLGGSDGRVLVTGVGSSWANTGDLSIGESGKGTLQLANGGTVTNTDGFIGSKAGSVGSVTVDGTGSNWTNSGNLFVGESGQGSLVITGAGTVNNAIGLIGNSLGSSGSATVSGNGSVWSNSGDLFVGLQGAATLSISNGGKVNNAAGTIGSDVDSVATAMVDGTGSSWTNTGAFTVGEGGKGTLAITGGGAVSNMASIVGKLAGSTGQVSVDGAGSAWTSTTLEIGQTGTGSLSISNSGAVFNTFGFVGTFQGGTGAVTVDGLGSSWVNSAELIVGNGGTGTLAVTGGATVTSASGVLAADSTGVGAATVSGPGSKWTNTGDLVVGYNGTGTLAITNGGEVSNAMGTIGWASIASGAVTVDGTASKWINTGNLIVGEDGKGALVISNGGMVSNDNGTVGQVAGSTGTVLVDGAGSAWTNTGNLRVGDDSTGALTIANGGKVTVGGLLSLGSQLGGVGTLNIGGAAGAAATAPGTLSTMMVNFGDGGGMVNFNHTDNSANYLFDAVFAGAGTINQNAGWTQLTADSSGFTGLTNVNGGRLAVNGSLGSLVNVNSGGTLGGSGTVGGIQAHAGGIIAPGNSIGTLSVMGNVAQAAGSIYEVELNAAGQSDLIKVTGTATIESGAILRPIRLGAAPLTVGAHYTVLQADGGISGMYSLQSNPFVVFAASYDATHAYLDLTQLKTFAEVGLTANQKAAGAGAERLGSGNLVYEAVLLSPTETAAQAAFDQLSGEVHASARTVIFEDSRFARDASLERLRAMDSERVAKDGGTSDPEEGKTARLLPSIRDLAYWGRAMGSWGHAKGDGNAATVKRDTSGFLMGADTRFGEEGRFGVMGGYSRSAFDVSDRNSSGSSENYHLGAYAGNRWNDLALRSGITYSWHDVSTSRAVAFPGFSDSLKADYKAGTTQAFAELGYRIKTERAELEPFANLAHVNVASDGFTERGGAAALASSGNNSGVTFSTLGLRASTNFSMDNGASVTARGSVGWRHAFGDTAPTTTLAFAGGSPFAITGAPIAKSAAVVEAGLDFRLTNAATLGLSYGGQFGSGLKDHSARVHFNLAF